MRRANDTAQPPVGSIHINGRQYAVSVRVSYDGVEYIGRLWFTNENPDAHGIPDRGTIPGRSKDEVVELARRLTEDELAARYRRAVVSRRRYMGLRVTTDELLRKVRYLNQVAISMRAGLIDLDGAAHEIDFTEQQLHDLVGKLRGAAGVEEDAS